MNDNDLIDELRASIRAHVANDEVPVGFVDQARRTAQRRSVRKAAMGGPPLLAVAGVATVLAAGTGSKTPGASAEVTVGGHVRDTAYIIRRVRANLAQATQNDVVQTVETGGNGNPGTDVTVTSWGYTDPQSGVEYSSSIMASPGGSELYGQYVVGTPLSSGMSFQSTSIDPAQHVYAVTNSVGPATPGPGADATQIKQDLADGQATVDGTVAVDGQQTIKLTVSATQPSTVTLYVDSQTYEPVESKASWPINPDDPAAGTDSTTEQWLPATPANIANAQLANTPAGFTEVTQATLQSDNPAAK